MLSINIHKDSKNLEKLEELMLKEEQVEIPAKHYFTEDGLYGREIVIPAGTLAIGHDHNHSFLEVFVEGELLIPTKTGTTILKAPFTGVGKPNNRKLGLALTDCRWITFHVVPEGMNSVSQMEEYIINKSITFKKHEGETLCQ